jgi:phospholipid-binding lipoprotein MlaA
MTPKTDCPLRTVKQRPLAILSLLLLAGLLAGCVSSVPAYGPGDPLEGANRVSYRVSDFIDRRALVPIARGYSRITPSWWRTGVGNFFSNLRNIDSAVNGLLQGKPGKAGTDLARVLVNSTVGIAGLIDVGTRVGLMHGEEDLGQTFAVWGYHRPPYLFLPAGGPSSVRDLPGAVIQGAMPRLLIGSTYNLWVGLLDAINARASALALTDARDSSALDGYAFTKDAFFQRRKFLIFDGDPPIEDFFDDETFDDDYEDDE